MEKWARSSKYYDRVQFLCVCVDSPGVAQRFTHMFQLKHAINCWIPSRGYFPVGFGQLGCNGFIVVDPKGNFVCRKTMAFLDYGNAAFNHVEQLLAPFLKNNHQEQQHDSTKTNGVAELQPRMIDAPSLPSREEGSPVPASPSVTDMLESGISSVGVESMDLEHEQCLTLLKELLATPTAVALEQVLGELKRHFAHEEALMKEHGFGGTGESSFSAMTSHVKDHQRILDLARQELQRTKAVAASAAASCSISSS